jgi:hypothetical protein
MLERDLETYLVGLCKTEGIYCRKFTSPGHVNVPDRILIHHGIVIFLELKKPKATPSPAQIREHTRMRDAGANVFWANSKEMVLKVVYDLLNNKYFLNSNV